MLIQIAEWTLSEKHVFGPEQHIDNVPHPTQLHWELTADNVKSVKCISYC